MPCRKPPAIPDALLDQLLDGADPRTAFNPDGVIDALKRALTERMLNTEMDHHLGGVGVDEPVNTRNVEPQQRVGEQFDPKAADLKRRLRPWTRLR